MRGGVRQQIGMAAEAIAGALDAHDDGVVEEAVEQRGGDDGVAEHLAPFCVFANLEIRGIRTSAASGATTDSFIGTETEPTGSLPSRRSAAREAVVCPPLTTWRSTRPVSKAVPAGPATLRTSEAVAAIPLL